MAVDDMTEPARLAALMEAEERAFALFDAIEAANLVAPGRTERAVEQDIRALAFDDFGVSKHWQDRKSTRLNPVTNAHLVCRLLLDKKKRENNKITSGCKNNRNIHKRNI